MRHQIKAFVLIALVAMGLPVALVAQPADYFWTSPSHNSMESMPCGGHDIGLNVWVENGDLLFYVSRSGVFDENNAMLKLGRFRIRLTPLLDTARSFRQTLHVNDGYMTVTDGQKKITLWVDVFKPVVHVEIESGAPLVAECDYESWRYKDRSYRRGESMQMSYKFKAPAGTFTHHDEFIPENGQLTFYHQNTDSTIFDATVSEQRLLPLRDKLYNPIGGLVNGGRLYAPEFLFKGTYNGVYSATDYQGWRYVSRERQRKFSLAIVLASSQGQRSEARNVFLTRVDSLRRAISVQADRRASRKWWNAFWQRSFIEGSDSTAEMARNYTLFRYMLGCNAMGEWPTKFNGGLFTFDPEYVDKRNAFTPDYRRWGGGTFTAQNQRLVYWPLLKTGDNDLMRAQLLFYLRILKNAELKTQFYWHHGGANFTEQIENFGLPNHDEYGVKHPQGFDAGYEYNAWLEYLWDTVLEFCQMALQNETYYGEDISQYVPLVTSCLDFFDQHYRYIARHNGIKELDGNGKLVLYPGSGAETFKMAYNASSTCAALKTVTQTLIQHFERVGADSILTKKYKKMLATLPDISYRMIDGHKCIAPATVWQRVNNTEVPQLYPVFPWRMFGVGRDSLDIALNTWKYDPYVKKFWGWAGWEQLNIFAACLGQTAEAAELTRKKLSDGAYRFPAFWGPGHDWSPDHNWGGSGMIGLQEMLLQDVGRKILLFPAWPRQWNIHFKLHANYQTTVEATLKDGKITQLKVLPASRKNDVQIMLR